MMSTWSFQQNNKKKNISGPRPGIHDSVDAFNFTVEPEYKANITGTMRPRLAPRSDRHFKIGPSFGKTIVGQKLYLNSTGRQVTPILSCRIDRGFEVQNNEWVGYKRNYFTLAAAFEFKEIENKRFEKEMFYILDADMHHCQVHYLRIKLSARCLNDKLMMYLVQHSPKRDKNHQLSPPDYIIVPGELPLHEIIKQVANLRNSKQITKFERLFNYHKPTEIPLKSIMNTYPTNNDIYVCAKYERIQFSTSAATHNLRSTTVNRKFALTVSLFAVVEDGSEVLVAKTETDALIVRGRSPSTYKFPNKPLKDRTNSSKKTLTVKESNKRLNQKKCFQIVRATNEPISSTKKDTALCSTFANTVTSSKKNKHRTSRRCVMPYDKEPWLFSSYYSAMDDIPSERDWLLEATLPTSEIDDCIWPDSINNSTNNSYCNNTYGNRDDDNDDDDNKYPSPLQHYLDMSKCKILQSKEFSYTQTAPDIFPFKHIDSNQLVPLEGKSSHKGWFYATEYDGPEGILVSRSCCKGKEE